MAEDKCPDCERPVAMCECLPLAERVVGTCGCGRPLYPALNEQGERIGVTHTPEDEDWHLEYFCSLRVELPEPTKSRKAADGVIVHPGMTVFAVSPWKEIETLYVEDDLQFASTCFPSQERGADACKFPISKCYSTAQAAMLAMLRDRKRENSDERK